MIKAIKESHNRVKRQHISEELANSELILALRELDEIPGDVTSLLEHCSRERSARMEILQRFWEHALPVFEDLIDSSTSSRAGKIALAMAEVIVNTMDAADLLEHAAELDAAEGHLAQQDGAPHPSNPVLEC